VLGFLVAVASFAEHEVTRHPSRQSICTNYSVPVRRRSVVVEVNLYRPRTTTSLYLRYIPLFTHIQTCLFATIVRKYSQSELHVVTRCLVLPLVKLFTVGSNSADTFGILQIPSYPFTQCTLSPKVVPAPLSSALTKSCVDQ
jgi:hypothetical protein